MEAKERLELARDEINCEDNDFLQHAIIRHIRYIDSLKVKVVEAEEFLAELSETNAATYRRRNDGSPVGTTVSTVSGSLTATRLIDNC